MNKEALIRVSLELRSGAVQRFQISEPIFRRLESLAAEGLNGSELSSEWIPEPMVADPPQRVRVYGELADGTRVDVSFNCDRASRLQREHGERQIDGAPYPRDLRDAGERDDDE